ncbi:MAG: TatD family hydrolase [Desulfuromonadales bacterium]
MSGYIDTHIHLDFLESLERQLDEARKAGVGGWVIPGTSCDRWPQLMATAERFEDVYAAPGIHPQSSEQFQKDDFETLRSLLRHPKTVAVGEVGLDRQVESSWQVQEQVFIQMLRLAREMDKPLLIHARRCTGRILELMQQEGARHVGGIFHAFSGSLETARKIIDMNFALGIGGVVTYATARRLPAIVKAVPEHALVLETDAPDLTPEPFRGQPNRPAYLELVAARVGSLRGWSSQQTLRITTANACRVLKLPGQLDDK